MPSTVSHLGCRAYHTATLPVATDENIDWLGSEASFAHLGATAPVPASSPHTSRHRLNLAGNRALHVIVLVRLRHCERPRRYMDRRLTEGKTKQKSSAASSTSSPANSTHRPSRTRHSHNPHSTSVEASYGGSDRRYGGQDRSGPR